MQDLDIATPRLTIAPLVLADADDLFAYRSDPAVTRFQPFEPRSPADAREFILAGLSEESEWQQSGIRLTDSGELVGDLGVRFPVHMPLQAEIGVTVAPPYQRTGVAAEAVGAVLDHLFVVDALHRAFASIDPANAASLALFARLGFRREAHFRRSLLFKGEWVDDVVVAMLADERRPPGDSIPIAEDSGGVG